jgi:tetratricopeptide (TPR) repeat protein
MKKLLIGIFGVILFFLLLELSFRAAGYFYLKKGKAALTSNIRQKSNKEFTILCLGDSYTFGVGTSYEYSYPAQLKKLLNKTDTQGKIDVLNLGKPGTNSTQTLKLFANSIGEYGPDLVIVMVGLSNDWNLEDTKETSGAGFWERLNPLVFKSRVLKLFKILAYNLEKSKKLLVDNPVNWAAGASVNKDTDADLPPEAKISSEEIEGYRKKYGTDLAIEKLKGVIEKYPTKTVPLYGELARYLRENGEYDLAKKFAQKGIELGSTYPPELIANFHMELVFLYRISQDWQLARAEMDYAVHNPQRIENVFREMKYICKACNLDFNKEISGLRATIARIHGEKGVKILDSLCKLEMNQKEKDKRLINNLSGLIALAHKNNIRVILMTYPFIYDCNNVIRDIAAKYKIDLVDNTPLSGNKELFTPDRHCNSQGNKLIAENLYNTLAASGVLLKNK